MKENHHLCRAGEIGDMDKTIDICSRRGAENAKQDKYNGIVYANNTLNSARFASLRKNGL